MARAGEMGYPAALSTRTWGFSDVFFGGQPLRLPRPFGSYIMENILFKVAYPAEFHAQTAVECAIALHGQVVHRLEQVERIVITTQEAGGRIISKTGPLHNPADRDHCLQYMVAVGLIKGNLTADDYEDEVAADPRIDALRAKMTVVQDPRFTADYLDAGKRSIANALQIFFADGTATENITVEYPLGHPRRRVEGLPLLWRKFETNLAARFPNRRVVTILERCHDQASLERLPVHEFMEMFVI
jgi:2-methylcitrate dehydratase